MICVPFLFTDCAHPYDLCRLHIVLYTRVGFSDVQDNEERFSNELGMRKVKVQLNGWITSQIEAYVR